MKKRSSDFRSRSTKQLKWPSPALHQNQRTNGMATFTENQNQIAKEFDRLKVLFYQLIDQNTSTTLSMGMSGDYPIAIKEVT